MAARNYPDSFAGWKFIDLPLAQARELVRRLFENGAGFACTSERADRRVYFTSEMSTLIVAVVFD